MLAREMDGAEGGTTSLHAGYRAWGFDDVGVFWDYGSLYQKRYSAEHPEGAYECDEHRACFAAALGRMTMWYCHALTTVYVVNEIAGDAEYAAKDYAASGWPYFESNV